tara:strand:+ start:239 stop:472 length:234 start_codon:yes stop_codon:yes gene_type:complete
MNNVVANFEFLSKKVKLSIKELNQEMSKEKRAELLEYQDRLMDSLFEEIDKISESGQLETMESLLSELEEIKRLATR